MDLLRVFYVFQLSDLAYRQAGFTDLHRFF
jgi:hypothetical protein